MKKYILITFIFCLLYSISVYADCEISAENFIKDGNSANLRFSIFNNDTQDRTNKYIFCTYTHDGTLNSIKQENFNIKANSKAIKNISFDNEESTSYAKIFAVNDVKNLHMDDICRIDAGTLNTKSWNFADKKFTSIGDITEPMQIDGLTFNYSSKYMQFHPSGYLYLYGGGSPENCSFSVHPEKNCTIRISLSSVSDEERTVRIATKTKILDEFTVTDKISHLFNYTGSGEDIYIYSKSSGIKIFNIDLDYTCKINLAYKNIYVDNFNDINTALGDLSVTNGGTLYLQSDYIPCNGAIELNGTNSNITITSADENTAVLDFYPFSKPLMNTAESTYYYGILLKGSGYTIKNIIVQKAPGIGIRLKGENSCNNIVENVISRYNQGTGIAINSGAYNNTLRCCDCYRNCDLYTIGENADGFHVAISTGKGNVLDNCRSWDNSDDGYDNFANYNDVTYIDCYAFHNGYSDIYTGKYDFDKTGKIDTNLALVDFINIRTNEFADNIAQGKFILPKNITLLTKQGTEDEEVISLEDFIGEKWCGNGNGFKLGSGLSRFGPQVTSEAYRKLTNCVAFSNRVKGFDRNNAIPTVNVTNFTSFDNLSKNYWSNDLTVEKAENIIGFDGKSPDNTDSNFTVNTNIPQYKKNSIRTACNDFENTLRNNCDNNIITGRFTANIQ